MRPHVWCCCAEARRLSLPVLLQLLLQLLLQPRLTHGREAQHNLLYRAAPACYNFSSELFAERTACLPELFVPGTWRGHAGDAQAQSGVGSTLYGTHLAQRAIYSHQHPPSCYEAKFLVYVFRNDTHGFGSVIHSACILAAVGTNCWPLPTAHRAVGGQGGRGEQPREVAARKGGGPEFWGYSRSQPNPPANAPPPTSSPASSRASHAADMAYGLQQALSLGRVYVGPGVGSGSIWVR